MKILLIHSQDVEVIKNKEATSNPQKFTESFIKMEGLILVCYVSVEDQDTYDTNLIAKQGAEEIEAAILQISGFPEVIRERNEEIRKYNKKIEKNEIKGKSRKIIELIMDQSMYRVDKVLVYPWAHLSKFLSKEVNAMEVCPKIASILQDRGIESNIGTYSLSSLPMFKSRENICPNGEYAFKHSLALPMYHELTEDDIDYIVHNLKETLTK